MTRSRIDRTTEVLIIGGGPVGLALATELGWRGIGCELIEQTDGAIATPKMNEVNVRSMEFCRRWGIAEAVMNCPFPPDYPLDVAFVTNLFGYELGRVPRPARNHQKPEPHSPMRFQVCSQIWFDPILQQAARGFASVKLRYRQRLDSFVQSSAGVVAEIVDLVSGRRQRMAADFLVGCDGAASLVRDLLSIELAGKGTIGNPVHMFFRAPNLLVACGKDRATFYLPIDRAGTWGSLRVIDPVNGLWRLMVDNIEGEQRPETVDREAYLRRALGRSFDVEWVGVSIWKRRSVMAERYGKGRVFLAGDAVHQLSPTGALGMNSGIADAVDLGWKLEAVLRGWGGEKLLETYDLERRPIGLRNVRMATDFYVTSETFRHYDPAIEQDSAQGAQARRRLGDLLVRDIGREFRTLGLQLGYRYDRSPICVCDGTPPPADDAEIYEPSARAGARAPHVWLHDGRSILDLFGRGFVLLQFPGAPDTVPVARAAADRGCPLTRVSLDEPDAAQLYQCRLVLVRPDGHVAWRADTLPADSASLINQVRGAASARAPIDRRQRST